MSNVSDEMEDNYFWTIVITMACNFMHKNLTKYAQNMHSKTVASQNGIVIIWHRNICYTKNTFVQQNNTAYDFKFAYYFFLFIETEISAALSYTTLCGCNMA